MKNVLRNTVAVGLAILVLFSTVSFTIHKHYCGDVLVDTSLFAEADSCGMKANTPIAEDRCTVQMKNCCKDVVDVIEGQDDLKIDFHSLDLQQQVFITSFVYSYINLFETVDKETIHFRDYSPPLIVRDIHILDEVYLI